MIGIGYVFQHGAQEIYDQNGEPADWMFVGYTAPPIGSKVTSGARPDRHLSAVSPDGFEWALLCTVPAWVPTGKQYRPPIIGEIGNDCVPSIENERNFKLRSRKCDTW